MKKQILKIMVVVIAMIALVTATGMSFAYWDSLSAGTDIGINLGENTVLTVTVDGNTAGGKTLVPSGVMMGATDVDEVVFNYTAELSKTPANEASFTVEVVENSVKIGGDDTYASLVNIEITSPETISTTASISVKITLSEPSDEAAYNAVKGKEITFSLSIFAE